MNAYSIYISLDIPICNVYMLTGSPSQQLYLEITPLLSFEGYGGSLKSVIL